MYVYSKLRGPLPYPISVVLKRGASKTGLRIGGACPFLLRWGHLGVHGSEILLVSILRPHLYPKTLNPNPKTYSLGKPNRATQRDSKLGYKASVHKARFKLNLQVTFASRLRLSNFCLYPNDLQFSRHKPQKQWLTGAMGRNKVRKPPPKRTLNPNP